MSRLVWQDLNYEQWLYLVGANGEKSYLLILGNATEPEAKKVRCINNVANNIIKLLASGTINTHGTLDECKKQAEEFIREIFTIE